MIRWVSLLPIVLSPESSTVPHQTLLSNAYRMKEPSKGRKYFQGFLALCDCVFMEIIRLIFVTSRAHSNLIPRGEYTHFVSARCAAWPRMVPVRSK